MRVTVSLVSVEEVEEVAAFRRFEEGLAKDGEMGIRVKEVVMVIRKERRVRRMRRGGWLWLLVIVVERKDV